jgi:hypothetical protein
LGSVQVVTYVPAVNTIQNLASLLAQIDRVDESKELYECAEYDVGTFFGRSSRRYEDIVASLARLSMDEAYSPIAGSCILQFVSTK